MISSTLGPFRIFDQAGERDIRFGPGCCLLTVTLWGLVSLGCNEAPPTPPVQLRVLATVSLEEFAVEAGQAFAADENVVVEVRAASTGEIADELAESRPADIVLLLGTDRMDRLQKEGSIVADSRWQGVSNRMVMLGRKDADYGSVRTIDMATLGFRRLIVPDPLRDPAGRYARRWLEGIGERGRSVWRQLENRRESVADVSAVTDAIARDRLTVGVVFATDIARVDGGDVLFRSPDLGIRYSFALVNRPGRPEEARRFLNFLRSPGGIDLLQSNGFLLQD